VGKKRNFEGKLGRNDPCPCDSGKKYKLCCEEKDKSAKAQIPKRRMRQLTEAEERHPVIQALKRKVDAQQKALKDQLASQYGVLVNFVSPTTLDGKKVWSIGNRVYPDQPANQTFHEFLLQLLRQTLGQDWADQQKALDPAERHFLYRCFSEYWAWTAEVSEKQEAAADQTWSAEPNGWAQYLRSVAWDVATLIHTSARPLPLSLVERLRAANSFQAVRYEVAVAGIFARLDCEIDWLDEDDERRAVKHAEFIATHRPSKQHFAVEVKSRRRRGVVNEQGQLDPTNPLRGDSRGVRRLFTRALEKEVDGLPYLIFIDVNAPSEPGAPALSKKWQEQVQGWMGRFPEPTEEDPALYNALYVTNFAPHYDGSQLALPGEWLAVYPRYAKTPTRADLIPSLNYALDRYELVPEIGPDGTLR
jgi:hypothetical protein